MPKLPRKPRPPKRQLVISFHSKETGTRHGAILTYSGSARAIAAEHARMARAAQIISPTLRNITPRISESNAGTTIGFHGIKQKDWNKIFGKKKKQKK